MPIRQIEAERNALKAYGQKYGKMPQTPEDWSQLHVLAYPNMNDLPAEFKNQITESAYQATNTSKPKTVDELRGGMEAAEDRVTELSNGNSALRVLQNAIGKKAGFKKTELGTSKIFEQAGVGGMGALTASLNTRGKEIETNRVDFRNFISEMTGNYKDMAGNALRKYEIATDNYNRQSDYLNQIERDMRQHEEALEIINLQFEQNKELARLKKSLSGSDDDDETTYYYDTLLSSAEGLNKLKGTPSFEGAYNAEVSALMAEFEIPEERRGEMESEVNKLMRPDVVANQVSNEDLASSWLEGRFSSDYNESGDSVTPLKKTGNEGVDFLNMLLDRDKQDSKKQEDKNIMTIGG